MGNSHDWHGKWEKRGHFWKKFTPAMVGKCPPEQVQDAVKATEHLQGECCGSSSQEPHCSVLGPGQHSSDSASHQTAPSGEEEEGRAAGTMATPTAAEPQGQTTLAAVTPTQNKSQTKSACIEG